MDSFIKLSIEKLIEYINTNKGLSEKDAENINKICDNYGIAAKLDIRKLFEDR